jgi:hypothetical protein
MLNVIYTECHKYALFVEWHYAEYCFAECRSAECRSAECRGSLKMGSSSVHAKTFQPSLIFVGKTSWV